MSMRTPDGAYTDTGTGDKDALWETALGIEQSDNLYGMSEDARMDENVLYSDLIDEGAVSLALENKEALSNLLTGADENNTEVQSAMEATDSNRFYTGPEASSQLQVLTNVNGIVSSMIESLRNLDSEKIMAKVKAYNAQLMEMKSKMRLRLLQEAVRQINAAEVSLPGYPKSSKRREAITGYNQGGGTSQPRNGKEDGIPVRIITTWTTNSVPNEPNQIEITTVEDKKYYIDYDSYCESSVDSGGGIKGWFKSFGDTSIKDLEKLLEKIPSPPNPGTHNGLPYNKDQLRPKDFTWTDTGGFTRTYRD